MATCLRGIAMELTWRVKGQVTWRHGGMVESVGRGCGCKLHADHQPSRPADETDGVAPDC